MFSCDRGSRAKPISILFWLHETTLPSPYNPAGMNLRASFSASMTCSHSSSGSSGAAIRLAPLPPSGVPVPGGASMGLCAGTASGTSIGAGRTGAAAARSGGAGGSCIAAISSSGGRGMGMSSSPGKNPGDGADGGAGDREDMDSGGLRAARSAEVTSWEPFRAGATGGSGAAGADGPGGWTLLARDPVDGGAERWDLGGPPRPRRDDPPERLDGPVRPPPPPPR